MQLVTNFYFSKVFRGKVIKEALTWPAAAVSEISATSTK